MLSLMKREKQIPSTRTILASNIRHFRISKGISQETLADLADLHRTYVSSVERSERNISIDNIEKIAWALDISVVELLKGKKE